MSDENIPVKPDVELVASLDAEQALAEKLELPSQYKLLKEIGAGGMGVVYLAKNVYSDRLVAIKVIKDGRITGKELERFKREAKASHSFSHPNAASVLDIGITENDGLPYLVMQYAPGESLDRLLQEKGHLDGKVVAEIAIQVCRAMSAAHAAGVIHRDLKPSNIIVQLNNEQPSAMVCDFGLAKLLNLESSQNLTQSGEALGTPLYMSPEQFMAMPVDARTDIYSLGAVLYECCMGVPPHRGDSAFSLMYKRLHEAPAPFNDSARNRADLEKIIFRCLELEANNRYQTVDELLTDLESFVAGRPLKTGPRASLSSGKLTDTLFKMAVAVAFALVIYLFVAFVQRSNSPQSPTSPPPLRPPLVSYQARPKSADEHLAEWIAANPNANTLQILQEGDGSVQRIASLKNIRKLIVRSPNLNDLSFLGKLPLIQILAINRFDKPIPLETWKAIGELPQLRELSLENVRLNSGGLRCIAGKKTMTRLVLSQDNLGNSEMEALATLPINSLSLSRCMVSSSGLSQVSKLSLKELDLGYNTSLSDDVLRKLISNMPDLRILWLRNTPISDRSLADISKLQNLRSLLVSQCNVSDAGVSKLSNAKELRQLDLWALPITDRSIHALASLPNLKHLYLSQTKITDRALNDLRKMKNLECLDVTDTAISQQGITELAKMPSLRLLYTSPLPDALVRQVNAGACHVDSTGRGLPDVVPQMD